MVSPKLSNTIVIALVFLFFTYESKGESMSKVNLSIYYDSLCQSCAIFIVKNIEEIFNNDLIDIVNLQLVPWANSYVNQTNNSISCQNGPDECELNSLEACALNIWPNVDTHYGLIHCFEFLAIDGKNKMWQNCTNQLGLPLEPIKNCFNRGNGTELGQKYIDEIAKLDPPHSFVPWVVVNNQPIGKDYENFTQYVCKAYKGDAIPAACNVHLNASEK
ncbi:gamma-interferon-responsive lysosomal thiol protein-like [Trifolium pratense]|uniref:gamma-interferon-responsive lysosomal thiol protein-like n=1 Tax=Trifolium pratense TaxID=57577 RepID=UPI001E69469B|nr:gamma-interferon-responsive lysosomal thiol protein-like [Trifolium pratense]